MAEPAQPPVGHLTNYSRGMRGIPGVGYNYIMAGNGIFVQSETETLTARSQLAHCQVRGLEALEYQLELTHGKIPWEILDQGIAWFRETPDQERYFAVRWNWNGYTPLIPEQTGDSTQVRYPAPEGAVLEFHSHGRMATFFSGADDASEQGFRIYGVAGRLDRGNVEIRLRLGIYGHFRELRLEEVFA